VALIYLLIIYFQGDSMILGFSGAKKADPYLHKQLINVVDEMRIAAGLPAVEVYVINSDAANAFATGRDQDHAKVAVTTGLMKLMNRDELQGVIAHEMSHVRNLDIRYAMLVAGLVGAVALLTDGLRRALWWSSFGGRGKKWGGGWQLQIIGLAVMIIMAILAPLAAVMLQMAISRKREFLADASSVELTRNPLGLANALDKLDSHHAIEQLSGANRATQHLFIVNPLKKFGMKSGALLSTHPPIQARIKLLKAMV
jgi:heat shock protein HtpX